MTDDGMKWKLVPVEPTDHMVARGRYVLIATPRNVYVSMIAGSPEPEPAAWQHRLYHDDIGKWSEWRDGRHDPRLANAWQERPLYAGEIEGSEPAVVGP